VHVAIIFSDFLSWTARWLCFSTSKEWMDHRLNVESRHPFQVTCVDSCS